VQGYVSCMCFWNKLSKPHPHPANLSQPAPGVLLLDGKASEKVREDHEEWLYDACSHSFMQVAWEDLGEPREKPILLAALGTSAAKVPHLTEINRAEKPPAPWAPDTVQLAIGELAWLRGGLPPFTVHEVRDANTKEMLVETVHDEIYCTTGEGLQLGVEPDGVYIERRGARVFTTKTLQQEELPDGTYRLTPEGGAPVNASAAFVPYDSENPDRHRRTPKHVIHVTTHRTAEALEKHLEPLDKLLRAAKKLNHSIVWIP
jgi:hypothetical protein